MLISKEALSKLTETEVGQYFFLCAVGYCVLIIVCDTIINKRLSISKNLLRHLLDGLTFATGITVGLSIIYPSIFTLVASNFVYVTVTSATCTFGPLINLAERYGWIIES